MPTTSELLEESGLAGSFSDPSEPAMGGGAAAGSLAGKIVGGVVGAILGAIPLIKHWAGAASKTAESASNKASAQVYHQHEAANARGMTGFTAVETLRLTGAGDVAASTNTALWLLKHRFLPARLDAATQPIARTAHDAKVRAGQAIGDAAIAHHHADRAIGDAKVAERTAGRADTRVTTLEHALPNVVARELAKHGTITQREAERIARRTAGKEISQKDRSDGKQIDRTLKGLNVTSVGVAASVIALAREAGLEEEACRKTNPCGMGANMANWAGLLAGFALVDAAFSLRVLYDTAKPLVSVVADGLEKAA